MMHWIVSMVEIVRLSMRMFKAEGVKDIPDEEECVM